MLWHKAWLETRWRFISALLILTVLAGSNVYDYLATQRLLPRLNATTDSPVAEASGLAGAIREAIELQKDFRGFIWYQAFRQNLTQMGVFFAVLLGCGGLLLGIVEGLGALHAVAAGDAQTAARRTHRHRARATLRDRHGAAARRFRSSRRRSDSTSPSSMRSRTASASSSSARCSSAWRRFSRRCSATSGGRC